MLVDKMTPKEKLLAQVACCNWLFVSQRWEWKDAVNVALEWWG